MGFPPIFVENTAKLLKNVPTANDIRYHLNKINNFEELEAQINQALKSRIPLGLKKGCLKIAIDLNLICYYGKPTSEELHYIYRSQAKSGTHSFYRKGRGQFLLKAEGFRKAFFPLPSCSKASKFIYEKQKNMYNEWHSARNTASLLNPLNLFMGIPPASCLLPP